MKNSKLRRALLLVASAVLLVSISVSATLAYLTSKTEVVNNTFSVGNVDIDLDESPVVDGVAVEGACVKSNEYKLLPGHQYDKDPHIHVGDDSEPCWLFVKVNNGISDIEAPYIWKDESSDKVVEIGTISTQMAANGWALVDNDKWPGVYAYETIVAPNSTIAIFDCFAIQGTGLGNTEMEEYVNAAIDVQAYAVQADGFTSAAAAYAAAPLAEWFATADYPTAE